MPNLKEEILNAADPERKLKKEILNAAKQTSPAISKAKPTVSSSIESGLKAGVESFINQSPLGMGKHLYEGYQAADRLNSGKNAVINTLIKDTSPGQLPSLSSALKEGQRVVEQNIPTPLYAARQLTNEKSGVAARSIAKITDVLMEGGTDPTNIITGPLVEGLGSGVKAGVGFLKQAPVAARMAAKFNQITNPIRSSYAASGLKNGIELVMDAFGSGPLRGVRKEITGPYQTILNNIGSDIAGTLRRVETFTKQHPNLPALKNWSAQNSGANPVLELVRRRVVDLGSSKPLQKWGSIAQDAQALGIDPVEVNNFAKEIFKHYNSAEYTIAKLKPQRVSPATADIRIKNFADQIFGKERVVGGPLQSGVLSNRPMQASIVHEAGLRQLMDILPGNQFLVPPGQVAPKGWITILNRGPLAPLAGYQVPLPLKAFLESELATSRMVHSSEVKNMYIRTFDTIMSLDKKGISHIKRGWLALPSTQLANATSNTFAAAIPLAKNGLSVYKDLLPRLGNAVNRVRAWENKGVKDAAIDRFNQFSNALHATQANSNIPQAATNIGKYSPHNWGVLTQNVVERAYKLALFEALEKKLGSKAAAATVDKYLFDYSDRGVALEIADRFGVWPFSTFGIKATNLLFDTVVNHPEMVARLPRYRYLATRGDNPADNERLPEYLRNSVSTIPIGNKEYVNLGRLHPFGGTLDMIHDWTKNGFSPQKEIKNALEKPMVTSALNIGLGRKAFTSNEKVNPNLLEKGQPSNELMGEMGKEAVNAFFPAGRVIHAGGELLRGQTAENQQEPRKLSDTILQYVFGIKATKEYSDQRGFTPEQQARVTPEVEGFVSKTSEEAVTSPDNPHHKDVEKYYTPKQVNAELKSAIYRLQNLKRNGQIVNKDGKLIGKDKLRNQIFYIQALRDRMQEVRR